MLILSELGQYLKTKREEEGISLERLQELTKIQKRYLAAIEEGRHEALPGAFYARAFVKSYAEALGLDPDEVLETYGSELPQPKQQTSDLPSRAERTKPQVETKKQKNKSAILPVLFGLIFFVVIIAGVYLMIQGNTKDTSDGVSPENDPSIEMDSNEDEQKAPANEEQNETEANNDNQQQAEPQEEDKDEESKDNDQEEDQANEGSLNLVSSEGRRTVYDVSGTEEMTFELKVDGDSYIDVRDENDTIIETVPAQSGDTVELDYSDREYVHLNIGNTSAVTLRFNGQPVEYENDTIHQHIIFEKTVETN